MIANKIDDAVAKSYGCEITEASKNSQQNNTETVANENYKEKPKEIWISTKKGIINELRLKYYNNGIQKTVEATGDLIGNRITGISKISETNNKDNQTIFKTSMLRSSWCDYGDIIVNRWLFLQNISY